MEVVSGAFRHLPPGKGDPRPGPFGDVAQPVSGNTLEAEVVVTLDRCVPLHAFTRLSEAN